MSEKEPSGTTSKRKHHAADAANVHPDKRLSFDKIRGTATPTKSETVLLAPQQAFNGRVALAA
jgi:hypothetical protein